MRTVEHVALLRRWVVGSMKSMARGPQAASNLQRVEALDAIGVGIGPFNLSLAALLAPTGLRARFSQPH